MSTNFLLSTNYALGTMLDPGRTAGNKVDVVPAFIYRLVKEMDYSK